MAKSAGLYCLVFGAACTAVKAQNLSCDVASIGGGWSGVYFAYRYYLDGNVQAKNICLFEASQRIGGRTYSKHLEVNGEKIVVDLGAYRFSPDMHLPGDVILNHLNLTTACYEPDCEPANKDFPPPFHFNYSAALRRIVDPVTGLPAGYATALETMVKIMADAGAHIGMGAQLADIQPAEQGGANLLFQDGSTVQAGTVLLNLPRSALLALPTVHASVGDRTLKMMQCVKFDHPKQFFTNMTFGDALSKAYAYYDDAWWVNSDSLNMTEGQWPKNAFQAIETSVGIPIGLHFNDGPVICDSPGKGCRGFLEVYYSVDKETFFSSLRTGPEEPFGELNASNPEDQAGLLKLHHAVMEATGPLFMEKQVIQPHTPPSLLVVGVWSRTGQGYTAPTKVYYSKSMDDSMEKACGVDGLTEKEYRDTILTPFKDKMPRVHVANNDWIAQEVENMYGDWAEESLLQAERALYVLNVAKPDWLNTTYYNEKIIAFAPTTTKPISKADQSEIVV